MTALLPPLTITANITPTAGSVFEVVDPGPTNLTLQCVFTYGSGGGTADAYVQTSVDSGNTWIDIAQFHLTTSNANLIYNLSSGTPITTAITPTDGSLTNNTSQDGIIGDKLRVKYKSGGTAYAGGTTLAVYAYSIRLTE